MKISQVFKDFKGEKRDQVERRGVRRWERGAKKVALQTSLAICRYPGITGLYPGPPKKGGLGLGPTRNRPDQNLLLLLLLLNHFSRVRLFETLWTAAYQAPPSLGFFRQEYWSGVPLPSPSLLLYKQNPPLCLRHCYHVGNGNHSYIFAWEIPWTKEPGRLQSLGSCTAVHN